MIPPVGIPQRPLAAPPLKSTKYLHYANRGLHPWKRQCIVRLLALGWSPRAIASREEVGETTVYDIGKNLLTLGTPTQPSSSWEKLGRKKKDIRRRRHGSIRGNSISRLDVSGRNGTLAVYGARDSRSPIYSRQAAKGERMEQEDFAAILLEPK